MFQNCQPAAIVFAAIAGFTARMDNNQQNNFLLAIETVQYKSLPPNYLMNDQ
jgi:hypothetical protein